MVKVLDIRPHRRRRRTIQSYLLAGANVPSYDAHSCHMANMIELVLPSAYPSSQHKLQNDQFNHFAQLTTKCHSACPGTSFPLIIAPSHGRSNTCFLGTTRVHNPSGISIRSAIFAQLTAECRYTLQRGCHFPAL